MVIWGYLIALAWGLFCLLLSLVCYKLGLEKKYTRKIVHILVGLEWFILYHTVGAGIHFLAVCLIFTALLLISYKKSLMPMISSDDDNAPGTVYFGVSMSLMALVSCFIPNYVYAFGIAVLCTSLGDGFASVIGNLIRKYNPKIYKNKSVFGTVAAFVFSFASVLIFARAYSLEIGISDALLIALFSSGLELVTGYGLDNITLPIGSSLLSYSLIYLEGAEHYAVAIALTPFVIALALEKNILTKKGIVFALILDVAVTVSLGNFGFVLLLSFLLLSVLIDKVKKHFKPESDDVSKRGEHRDEVQVLANGIIPMFCAILYLIFDSSLFIIAYSAALAECFADTAASGIGVLSKKAYDPIRFKEIPVGMSGGMSLIGTIASFVASALFSLIPLAFAKANVKLYAAIAISAFAGAIFDSLLGSLAQAKFKCKVCGKLTEKETHCDATTEHIGGIRFIDNDTVNIISVTFSAILSVFLASVF